MKSCVHGSYICTGSPKPLHLSHEDGHFPDIQYVFWCISERWIPQKSLFFLLILITFRVWYSLKNRVVLSLPICDIIDKQLLECPLAVV